MNLTFQPATRHEAKARVAMIGPTGSGKTWTSLQFARILAGETGRIGLIDTENASASLYADVHDFQTAAWYPPYDAAKLAAAGRAAPSLALRRYMRARYGPGQSTDGELEAALTEPPR